MVFVYWILITVTLSAIVAALFATSVVLMGQTTNESDSIFRYSFYGGLIGGLLGTILGLILGAIAGSMTPYGDDLLGFGGVGQAIVFMQVLAAFWLICTVAGAISGGLRYLDKNDN